MSQVPSNQRALLALAVEIIEDERECVVTSFRERDGKVKDYDARKWLRRYDRFLKPAKALLRKTS